MLCSRSLAVCGRWLILFATAAIGALLLNSLHAADSAITALVSCPVVQPGGTAQITVTLPSPVAITHGRFQIDLDPAVFGDISAIHVFSASGDQQGVAKLQGQHAEVVFGANSGGIGRLPNVPVAEITVPVLATATVGVTGAVTLQSSSPWYEVSGKRYAVSFRSPGVAIGAGISIQSVVPGGGQLAAGTVVAINGQGFTSSSKLRLDGVAWSNPQFVSSSLLNITLMGPNDLAGKLFELTDASGASTRYYSELTPTSIQDDAGHSGYWPIFPTATYQAASTLYSGYLWFENDTRNSIDVMLSPIFEPCTFCGAPAAPKKITVSASGVSLVYYNYLGGSAVGTLVSATAPIHLLQGLAPSLAAQLPDLTPTALSPFSGSSGVNCGATTVLDYRVGDPAPQPIPCETYPYPAPMEKIENLTAGTDDGNPWLQASSVPGSSTKFTVSMNPAGLALGSHLGVVTAAVSGAPFGSVSRTFGFNVHAEATIAEEVYQSLAFDVSSPFPRTITITSTSPSVPITINSSDSWLIVTPTSATTPATLTARIAPLAPLYKNATITIRGPGNSLALPVSTNAGLLYANPYPTFAVKAGATSVMTSILYTPSPFDFTVATDSDGKWLNAVASPPSENNSNRMLTIRADPSGLAAGLYHGTVTVTPTNSSAFWSNPVRVSVTLSVWGDPTPPPIASPASLEFSPPPYLQLPLNVTTGSLLLPISVTHETDDGMHLVIEQTAAITPTSLYIQASSAYPGTYHGSVTITAPPGSANSVIVPVTITTPPNPPVVDPIRPKISAIVNAGSMLTGSISLGEIVSVFGLVSSIGTAGVNIGGDGKVNRALYGNRVLFNGVAAPLTYMSSAQINAVVPYEIASSSAVTVEIDGGGVHSAPWSVPLAPSAPGLFTQNETGQGAGAILNQDSSVNTPQNPASRGTIVQILLTGEGATTPPGVTGGMTGLETKKPTQDVSVQIGGVDAKVVSATTAPYAIAGLFQVNAEVPAGSPSGSVPVLVRIGNASSQSTATISVQ
jgi:uncharacterized protein (TIGR03437 family)